jgi:hypothetical protein
MQLEMLGLSHHLQVSRIIISLITIDMVNNLSSYQWASKFLFSNHPVQMPLMEFYV